MKTIDTNPKTVHIADPVICEVRRIKEQIVAEHDGDIRLILKSLRERQLNNPRLTQTLFKSSNESHDPKTIHEPISERFR
jgi:hypothetical protein